MEKGLEMRRKGMFEWKILAAIFAVLIVLSSALVGSTGIKDLFLIKSEHSGDYRGMSFSPRRKTGLTINQLTKRAVKNQLTN